MSAKGQKCECYKSEKERDIRCPHDAKYGKYCGIHKNCEQKPDYLSEQPSHILKNMGQFLDDKSLVKLAKVSRSMRREFKQDIEKRNVNILIIFRTRDDDCIFTWDEWKLKINIQRYKALESEINEYDDRIYGVTSGFCRMSIYNLDDPFDIKELSNKKREYRIIERIRSVEELILLITGTDDDTGEDLPQFAFEMSPLLDSILKK